MAIDISKEQILPLAALGRQVGKNACTLKAWIHHGRYGIRLEAVMTPRGPQSTVEAVQRFLDALTDHISLGKRPSPTMPSSVKRRYDRAMEELRAAGLA
jgi:hypothetical protein